MENDRSQFDSRLKGDPQPPVKVPVEALSSEALRSVLESFILREGTDYGQSEISLDQKVQNLSHRIFNGSAHLIFDPNSESVTFLTDAQWRKIEPKDETKR